MAIHKVAVLGCGLMGSGIAQVCAQAGRDVTVIEVAEDYLKKGLGGIEKQLGKMVEKGKLTAGDRDAALKAFANAEPELMQAAQRNIIHKNNASRKVSRLSQPIAKLAK